MTSPVIIRFKKHPELGKLKLSHSPASEGCKTCELSPYNTCYKLDKHPNGKGCAEGDYIYEKVSK